MNERQPSYGVEDALNEAQQIQELTGKSATSEDYDLAQEIITKEKLSEPAGSALSFDDLYERIRLKGVIEGSKRWVADELIANIERIRHGHRPINWATRSEDIRDAVERLLKTDKVYEKYTNGSKAKKLQ